MADLQPGLEIGGRYVLGELISEGGYGQLWAATQSGTGQQVVFKTLRAALMGDPKQVERFAREARLVALLNHPHTVRVIDAGKLDGGMAFLAMERLHGCELREALEQSGGRLEPKRALDIVAQILSALEEVHAAGVVHRDLKLENIFLVEAAGTRDFVKILDFGIAQTPSPTDPRLTETGRSVGTPHYMSPEQVLGTRVDGRADLYALGVILYRCLSGQLPVTGRTPGEILIGQVQRTPVPLPQLRPDLPRMLCDIVTKALQKRASDRYEDARTMRAAVLRAGGELGPDQRPTTPHVPLASLGAREKTAISGMVPLLPVVATAMSSERMQRLRVRIEGQGARTLLLGHSLGGDSDAWQAVAEKLQRGFRVVRFDWAGHGPHGSETFEPERHTGLHAFADDLLALVNAIDADTVTWVGHGLAGIAGCLAALRAPARFTQLVLVGAAPKLVRGADWAGGLPPELAAAQLADIERQAQVWLSGFGSDFAQHGLRGTLQPDGTVSMRPDIALAVLQIAMAADHRKEIARMLLPTALVATPDNPICQPEVVAWWRQALPQLRVVSLPVAGHLPMTADADATAAALRQAFADPALFSAHGRS